MNREISVVRIAIVSKQFCTFRPDNAYLFASQSLSGLDEPI